MTDTGSNRYAPLEDRAVVVIIVGATCTGRALAEVYRKEGLLVVDKKTVLCPGDLICGKINYRWSRLGDFDREKSGLLVYDFLVRLSLLRFFLPYKFENGSEAMAKELIGFLLILE